MRVILFLRFALALGTLGVQIAAEGAPKAAVPVSLTISDRYPTRISQSLASIAETTLGVIQSFPPPMRDHLFHWEGPTEVLQNKEVMIYVTDSDDPLLASLLKTHPTWLAPDTSALTVSAISQSGGKASAKIFVFLFADRLCFTPNGQEHPRSFSRVAIAMAHEIFGNVQFNLEQNIATAENQDWAARQSAEIRAFAEGIAFIDRLLSQPKFPEKMARDFRAELDYEKRALASWKKMHSPPAPKLTRVPEPLLACADTISQKVGRNDPCPCGSGKKFKHCHLR